MVWPKHLSSDMFLVWEQLSRDKMMIFSRGLALYLYMILWNIWEGKECSPSHWQDLWTVHSDFPSAPKSLVKFLWFDMTHRNVFLATQRLRSQNRDRGGWYGCCEHISKCFPIRKVCWNSAKLPLGGKLRDMAHRNVFPATWKPQSQARDCGGRAGVPNAFQTRRFWIQKVDWNSANLQVQMVLQPHSGLSYSLIICKSQEYL